jgi:LuxR family maltose regulon positive regulatory protein
MNLAQAASKQSSAAAGDAPADGLRGRLSPPEFIFDPVSTASLSHLLGSAAPPKLVTVTAPAGYGKTVALSRLHRALAGRGQRCLWIGLDDRDRAWSALSYLLRAALARAGAPYESEHHDTYESLADLDAPFDSLLAHLSRLEGDTTIFIDNLGFCTDRSLGRALERLILETGPRLRMVISTTPALPLDIARLKLEIGVLELKAPQLRFDRQCTVQLFDKAGLPAPSDQELQLIEQQTEGWPAAIRLLQVLRSQVPYGLDGAAAPPLHFDGDQSDIAQVLTRRVLIGLDHNFLEFLTEIALLREFSVELALAATGRAEAPTWIATLVERNILIFPLDHSRRWYRLHTLLRDYLLAEGRQQLSASGRHAVLERAARWHAERGDDVNAIGLALDAHAFALAKTLVDRVAGSVAGDQGQMDAFINWFDRLQAAGCEPSLDAHGWFVWALADTMQFERARKALDAFDRRMQSIAPSDSPPPELQSRLEFLRILVGLYIDRLATAHSDALAWLAKDQARDALTVSTVAAIAAIAETNWGQLAAASAHMALAEGAIERTASGYGLAWVTILRAFIDLALGRPDVADHKLAATRARIVASAGAEASIVATFDFAHARVLADLGQVEPARRLALRGLTRAAHHGIVASAELGLSACVELWPDEAGAPYAESALEKIALRYPPRAHCLLLASCVRRLLRQGRHGEAQTLAARAHQLANGAEPPLQVQVRGVWMMMDIEVLLATGAAAEALAAIERQLKLAQADGRQRDRIELLLAGTDAYLRMAQRRKALRMFTLAIVAAAPGQLIGPFNNRVGLVRDILGQFTARDFGFTQAAELALLDAIARASADDNDGVAAAVADHGGSVPAVPSEMPTPREMELLDLLGQGLNNQQIADRLLLSVTTVKWHLANLYAKLAVRNRAAALVVARVRKLLSG